jgi:hypothetical protein
MVMHGHRGNFEVVVPDKVGQLQHWWRNNDDPNMPWAKLATFGGNFQITGPTSLIQSNYGHKGNFEVIASNSHWWRNNDDTQMPWIQGEVLIP